MEAPQRSREPEPPFKRVGGRPKKFATEEARGESRRQSLKEAQRRYKTRKKLERRRTKTQKKEIAHLLETIKTVIHEKFISKEPEAKIKALSILLQELKEI